ncbi:MAG: carbamoyltransferase HypF [Verrucomicrobiota bacterium]
MIPSHELKTTTARLKIALRGAVQGVGFRPFVFRLAEELELVGWVNNSPQGVFIEAEGGRSALEKFLFRLEAEKPARSSIQSLESSWREPIGYDRFEIRPSETSGGKSALVLPDIATCPACLREILDPANRRFRYPFTNCTNCGPRFSLIDALPYDRANTSMRGFKMCPQCQAEYKNPRDRRFHAQPNACPACGPQLQFWDAAGKIICHADAALKAAANAVRDGKIVAVKGVGGFHLLADARDEKVVRLLRERKHREEKPFALMFPSLASVKPVCEVSSLEERLLLSPEAPIVLLRRNLSSIPHPPSSLSPDVAPGNPGLGVMLPSNPLQHLLMAELDFPVIATSGNLSDEPICIDEVEALNRLRGIADVYLVHNRPIIRHMDDSIVRVILRREMVLRRARGFAPLPVAIGGLSSGVRVRGSKLQAAGKPETLNLEPKTIIALGAHLKNSVALAVDGNVFISQHIGDLETEEAHQAFRRVAADLPELYGVQPEVVAADLHPDYLSTKYAGEFKAMRHVGVQHHIAHVLSCIAENEVPLPALGVAWDGTGYGTDGTIWGGEFFLVTENNIERVAHLRPFPLPGGDKAMKEPRRVALGLLYELYGESAFEMEHLAPLRAIPPVEMMTLRGMLQRRFNSPLTSSMGRIFDAVASLTNLRQHLRFEGQAAMELEFAIGDIKLVESYSFSLAPAHVSPSKNAIENRKSALVLDWSPLVQSVLSDTAGGVGIGEISAKFHNALAESVVAVARKIGEARVVLSGGCFQNRYLVERTVNRLRAENFQPHWHQRVPPNDGGIALGQVVAARRARSESQIENPKSYVSGHSRKSGEHQRRRRADAHGED